MATRTSGDMFIKRMVGNNWRLSLWIDSGNGSYEEAADWAYPQIPPSYFTKAELWKVQAEMLNRSNDESDAKILECLYRYEGNSRYLIKMSMKVTGRLFKHPQLGYEYAYASLNNKSNWSYKSDAIYNRTCPQPNQPISNCTFTINKNTQPNGYWSDAAYRCGNNRLSDCWAHKNEVHLLMDKN
ncbi:MAG: hypothetical protein K0R08_2237 [Solimicrobium sp.]|nr:hypothetical protein [Solimicrobium sp.]